MLHGPTGKILVLNVDISAMEQKDHHCWMEVPLLAVLFLGIHADVPELHAHPVQLRHGLPRKRKKRTEFIRHLWLEIMQGSYDDTVIDQEIAKVGGCLIIDAKGVFDAIHRSESAALYMQDKRLAVEDLALREAIGRTKTLR